MKNFDYILKNFRLVDGKLERLHEGEWVDTSVYADQKRIRVEGNMVKREKIVQALSENEVAQEEIEPWSAKAQARLQKQQDSNRIERALFRKEARKLNESNDVFDELLETIPKAVTTNFFAYPMGVSKEGGTLVIQLSDVHLGSTIALPNNIVNTRVLSKRIKTYVDTAIQFGLRNKVRRCVFALTGDLVTSNRRPGEIATLEYNRAHAVLNAFEIISGAINRVSHYIPVTNVVSVCANESRVDLFLELNHKSFYENFDWVVDRMLNAHYNGAIKFSEFVNPVERLVDIDGVNVLLSHGLVKPKDPTEKQVAYYKTKYPEMDYMIVGHIHSELVALNYSRSSGLPGANEYSTFTLGIPSSCPGQTFHLVQDSRMFSFPVDLTRTSDEFFQFTEPPKAEAIAIVRERL